MSSNSKKKLFPNVLNIATCACGCCKPKPTDISEPKPKEKTTNEEEDYTSTTIFSFKINTPTPCCYERDHIDRNWSKMINLSPKLSNSTAIMKDSDDPYHDFRQSMLQMIFEKEIHSKDDLQELLNCFLQLNPPSHHDIIVKAFMEIWSGVISTSPLFKKPSAS